MELQILDFKDAYSYTLILQTEDKLSKQFLIDFDFSTSFTNSPKLVVSLNSSLLSKYCTVIFEPDQIEIELDNYYKLSQD